jgi:hypothetical protein
VDGKRVYLGYHTTEQAAALAVHKYAKDGVNPVEHRVLTSQFKGVCWDHRAGKWRAQYKEKHLGNHTTEEAAARAYDLYVEDGVDHVQHRGAHTSEFKGVSWHKSSGKWQAVCKKTHVGLHATEEAAARAYNKEAELIGRVDLNVIPPAGDADSGSIISNAAAAAAAAALPGPATPARGPDAPHRPRRRPLRRRRYGCAPRRARALRLRQQHNQHRRHPRKQQRGRRHRRLASKRMRSSTST